MVEYAHLQSHQDGKGKGRFGISEEAALFAGTHRKSGDHVVRPDLLGRCESGGRTPIMKQICKAREERQPSQKTKKEDTRRVTAGQVALILSR